jgi:hypothetical protein
MKMDYKKACALTTESEFRLISDSKPTNITAFKPAELKKKINQARKHSDKWRQLAIKQGNSTDGSAANSFRKHEFFHETLNRFEARLSKLSAPAPLKKAIAGKLPGKKTALKKVPAKKAAARKPGVAKPTSARSPMSLANQAKKKSISTSLRITASGFNTRMRGHVSASGRRNQAARSSRKRS